MAGVTALRKLQGGLEATAGSAEAATFKMRMTGSATDELEVVFPEEHIGYLSGVDRSYIPSVGVTIAMEGPATFEQLPIVLSAAIEDDVSGAQDGSGPYAYDYVAGTTSQNSIKTYTWEWGGNEGEEEASYCFVEDFTLSGTGGEAVQLTANWRGRQAAPSTFTSLSGVPAVEEILFNKGTLAIGAVGTAHGSLSPMSQTWIGFELSVTTGVKAIQTGDGNLYFSFAKVSAPEVTLQVTMEHNSTSIAEVAAWRAQTARNIRMKFLGTVIAGGSTYTAKTLLVDMSGKWESFDALGDEDGNTTITGLFRARYDATSTKFFEMIVANSLATIPSAT